MSFDSRRSGLCQVAKNKKIKDVRRQCHSNKLSIVYSNERFWVSTDFTLAEIVLCCLLFYNLCVFQL